MEGGPQLSSIHSFLIDVVHSNGEKGSRHPMKVHVQEGAVPKVAKDVITTLLVWAGHKEARAAQLIPSCSLLESIVRAVRISSCNVPSTPTSPVLLPPHQLHAETQTVDWEYRNGSD